MRASHFKGFTKRNREKSEEGRQKSEREQKANGTRLLFCAWHCAMLETLYFISPEPYDMGCVHQFIDEETEA